jgi:hypothetical protein
MSAEGGVSAKRPLNSFLNLEKGTESLTIGSESKLLVRRRGKGVLTLRSLEVFAIK